MKGEEQVDKALNLSHRLILKCLTCSMCIREMDKMHLNLNMDTRVSLVVMNYIATIFDLDNPFLFHH